MKTLLLALAVLFVMGALSVAQTYDQSQDTTSTPSTLNGAPANDSALNQQTNDSATTAVQANTNGSNFVPQDFRGTELEKAYQQEAASGWNDPNITKSNGVDAGGGGQ